MKCHSVVLRTGRASQLHGVVSSLSCFITKFKLFNFQVTFEPWLVSSHVGQLPREFRLLRAIGPSRLIPCSNLATPTILDTCRLTTSTSGCGNSYRAL